MTDYYCQNCGKNFVDNKLNKNRFCTVICKREFTEPDTDENKFNKDNSKDRVVNTDKYKDGRLHRKYKKNKQVCEICDDDTDLEVHHIIPVDTNKSLSTDKDNLICVCKYCHSSIDKNRNLKESNQLTSREKRIRCKLYLEKFVNN